jgi:hypothetical protein
VQGDHDRDILFGGKIAIEVQAVHVHNVDGKTRQRVFQSALKAAASLMFGALVQHSGRDLRGDQESMTSRPSWGKHE